MNLFPPICNLFPPPLPPSSFLLFIKQTNTNPSVFVFEPLSHSLFLTSHF